MNEKKQSTVKRLLGTRGMGAVITAFVGLIIIYVAFGLIDRNVFSGQNVMNLLRSMSKYLLIGVGQSYLLITGNIDLSIGSMVGMSAMVSATLMTMGVHPVIAMAVALLCCLVCGVINGTLVGKFKLPPFIATLGTMFAARGVAYMVNNNRNTDAIATGIGKEAGDSFQNLFYYGKTFGIYNTFWIALILFLIFFFLLSRTRTGRHIYAIGSNVEAAKLSGVDAGVIGGISPLGGTGLLLGTFAGASVWQTLENGLNMIGAQVGIQRLVIGIIVVFAVLLDVVVRSGSLGKKNKQ